MKLKEGNSAQAHVKEMTELFDFLSVAGETVSEEYHVVYLLASLPESYNVLVTALEANEEVPKLEVVTERILHQESKAKDKSGTGVDHAMTSHNFTSRNQNSAYTVEKWVTSKNSAGDFKREKIITRRGKESFTKLLQR